MSCLAAAARRGQDGGRSERLQKASREAPQWLLCSPAGGWKLLPLDERNILLGNGRFLPAPVFPAPQSFQYRRLGAGYIKGTCYVLLQYLALQAPIFLCETPAEV